MTRKMSEKSQSTKYHGIRLNAEEVLLEKHIFDLKVEDFKRFKKMLDRPPSENPSLKALLEVKAPW
ncbi:MAG: DUF1778 domain-containing protein [Methylococcaceae bacterium]